MPRGRISTPLKLKYRIRRYKPNKQRKYRIFTVQRFKKGHWYMIYKTKSYQSALIVFEHCYNYNSGQVLEQIAKELLFHIKK